MAIDTTQAPITSIRQVLLISAGASHSVALLWGLRIRQIACGDNHCLAVTMEGEGVTIKMVVAGAEHTVAITEDGELYGWGWGQFGNLGLGDKNDRNIP
ncbi:hypothetical protein L6452_02130 [Arctium lappa]|uniref:Uncharacterized protein n=1 Tax=Arctium lappa TaxID=4217 RepID=A0ACB9FJU8_ARCLA|nr:hypothetical protein L6452_02130 [Arctium lappa]